MKFKHFALINKNMPTHIKWHLTKAKISKNLAKVSRGNNVVLTDTLKSGIYTFSFEHISALNVTLKANDNSGAILGSIASTGAGRDKITFSLIMDAKVYLTADSNIGIKYQIERGSLNTDYVPYQK